jgi:hypothetical protein
MKLDLERYREVKEKQCENPDSIKLNETIVENLDTSNKDRLLMIRAGQRRIYQMAENMKRRSEDERRELDTHNLTLQSLLYGKDYFLKEVHFCKEYKTPHLQQALNPDVYLQKFKNLPPNVTE